MTQRRTLSIYWKAVLGILCLSAATFSAAIAQQSDTPVSSTAKIIPLVSDTCPVLHIGDSVSLDWNPYFESAWAVTGLRRFGLRFAPLKEDGIAVQERFQVVLGDHRSPQTITGPVFGSFHIELTVDRKIPPGTYRLVGANAVAQTIPAYQGPTLLMTATPVNQRYCITVATPATQPASSTEN